MRDWDMWTEGQCDRGMADVKKGEEGNVQQRKCGEQAARREDRWAEMQEVQADRRAEKDGQTPLERQLYRGKETGDTLRETGRRWAEKDGTHAKRQAGKGRWTEAYREARAPKGKWTPEMEQKVVCGVRLDPGLGETVAGVPG